MLDARDRSMPNTESLTIPFTCPFCGHFTEVEARFAGQSGPCVSCSNTITVPSMDNVVVEQAMDRTPSARLPIIKLGMAVGAFISCCVLVFVAWSLLQPAFQAARDAARCSECEGNLRRIGLALEDYHNEHKSYPPAIVYDDAGKPMHSWRVLILPYLGPEAQQVYEKYDMNQPWDSKENMVLLNDIPHVYQCPSDGQAVLGETSYLAVVGRETVISNVQGEPTHRRSISDLPSETMVIMECAGSNVNWLQPKDIPVAALRAGINSRNTGSPASLHTQGVNVLMADQSVVCLPDGFDTEDLRGMATIGGDEYIESLDELER